MEKRLGKGLGALIGDGNIQDTAKRKVTKVALSDIDPNPFQPRKSFGDEKMEELVSSIKQQGVIQPILLRPKGDRYELVAGERRWRAAQVLSLEEIPAMVRSDIDDSTSLEISIIENVQREELNPVEEAEGYKELIDKFEYTLEKVGKMVGKDKTTISNSLRLLQLPREVRNLLVEGKLTSGHAKAVLGVMGDQKRTRFAQTIANKGLSVREAEQLVRKVSEPKTRKPKKTDPEQVRIEEDLQHRLGTKVSIVQGKKRGKIEVQYFSNEDLERILKLILGEQRP